MAAIKKIVLVLLILLFATLFGVAEESGQAEKIAKIDEFLKTCYKNELLNGSVLVAEKGKIIYKKAFGTANAEWDIPSQTDCRYYMYSMTKQFTSMLVMKLVEEGKLKLDATISDYLPYYREDTGKKITLHHLITHTHGIPSPPHTSMPLINTLNTEEYVKKHYSGDLSFEPGSQFRYGIGFDICAAIIRKVTGKTMDQVLKEKILAPLNMKNSGIVHNTVNIKKLATPYMESINHKRLPFNERPCPGGSGMYSTVDDLFLWDRALASNKLVSQKSRDLIFGNHVAARTGHYGYGWDLTTLNVGKEKKKITWHGGGGSTIIFRSEQDNNLVILLSNITTQNYLISRQIMNILYNLPYTVPRRSIHWPLFNTIEEKGIDAAVKLYHRWKKKKPHIYNFGEDQLNRLGYTLITEKKIDEAIVILKLNVEAFPNSWNVYDSLGEAYLKKGDKPKALENYKKAVKLNPGKTARDKANLANQQKIIKDLEKKE